MENNKTINRSDSFYIKLEILYKIIIDKPPLYIKTMIKKNGKDKIIKILYEDIFENKITDNHIYNIINKKISKAADKDNKNYILLNNDIHIREYQDIIEINTILLNYKFGDQNDSYSYHKKNDIQRDFKFYNDITYNNIVSSFDKKYKHKCKYTYKIKHDFLSLNLSKYINKKYIPLNEYIYQISVLYNMYFDIIHNYLHNKYND